MAQYVCKSLCQHCSEPVQHDRPHFGGCNAVGARCAWVWCNKKKPAKKKPPSNCINFQQNSEKQRSRQLAPCAKAQNSLLREVHLAVVLALACGNNLILRQRNLSAVSAFVYFRRGANHIRDGCPHASAGSGMQFGRSGHAQASGYRPPANPDLKDRLLYFRHVL